jgi:hypothetical protein
VARTFSTDEWALLSAEGYQDQAISPTGLELYGTPGYQFLAKGGGSYPYETVYDLRYGNMGFFEAGAYTHFDPMSWPIGARAPFDQTEPVGGYVPQNRDRLVAFVDGSGRLGLAWGGWGNMDYPSVRFDLNKYFGKGYRNVRIDGKWMVAETIFGTLEVYDVTKTDIPRQQVLTGSGAEVGGGHVAYTRGGAVWVYDCVTGLDVQVAESGRNPKTDGSHIVWESNLGAQAPDIMIADLQEGFCNGDSYSVLEDEVLHVAAPGLLGNDWAEDPTRLLATTGGFDGPSHGLVWVNPDGSFSYQASRDYNGTDDFPYTADYLSPTGAPHRLNGAYVSITVIPVNDAPVAADISVGTDEEAPAEVTLAATDAEGDACTFFVVSEPAHGTLSEVVDGKLTYTPDLNYNGPDSFSYGATDGELDSNTAMVQVRVDPVNDPPFVVDRYLEVTEDTPASGHLMGTDIDGDAFVYRIASQPAHGHVALVGSTYYYSPDADFWGADSFTYTANDGQAESNIGRVRVTVRPVNDAPIAVDDAFTTSENTGVLLTVLDNDTDVDGDDIVEALKISDPLHGTVEAAPYGAFLYTPAPGWSGTDSFTYTVSDGDLVSIQPATVTITVTEVNDAPVAGPDGPFSLPEDGTYFHVPGPGAPISLLLNDTDTDGPLPLTAVLVSTTTHGALTFTPDGGFTYQPEADWSGTDSFDYQAYDGDLYSNTITVQIDVTPVNDDPTAVDDDATTLEDVAVTVDVLANDADGEGDTLSVTETTDPANGSVTINGDGTVTYTPAVDFSGVDSFGYTVSDGNGGTGTGTVTITVTEVNDAPYLNLSPEEQSVQYSDVTQELRAEFGDIDGPH